MANAAQYMELRNDAAILGEGNPLVTKEELDYGRRVLLDMPVLIYTIM